MAIHLASSPPLSNGTVPAAGIGSGRGGGVGSGYVRGLDRAKAAGFGGGVFKVGGGVTAPTVLQKVEPEYSEEAARPSIKAPWCSISKWIRPARPPTFACSAGLGLGLDEKASKR